MPKRIVEKSPETRAIWLIAKLFNKKQCLQFSIFAAEQALYIFEKKYPNDVRPRKAIEAAKAVLKTDTTKKRNIAVAAAYAAEDTTPCAANAANIDAACAANAAYAAADVASIDAIYAADAAATAAMWAVNATAGAVQRKIQRKILQYGKHITQLKQEDTHANR